MRCSHEKREGCGVIRGLVYPVCPVPDRRNGLAIAVELVDVPGKLFRSLELHFDERKRAALDHGGTVAPALQRRPCTLVHDRLIGGFLV